MDYQYENLDAERFQQFCQSLLTREHSDMQCFPVGQPDGGRDAIASNIQATIFPNKLDSRVKSFIVYQIKFVKKPLAESDPHGWLVKKLKEEIPKIKQLVPEGAQKYYFLTNIPGTAHPNVGSIDRLNKLLEDELKIPFQCLWRDDLNRRLDLAWELKWIYPELLTGLDMLHYLLEMGLSEDNARRTNAIRAFVNEQYELDEEVRFKQIELKNKLLDLFIDVPTQYASQKDTPKLRNLFFHLINKNRNAIKNSESINTEQIGAATLLLDAMTQEFFPQIVLEGAPGQGKSTIAQYICQVHRMYILQKQSELQKMPDHLKPNSLRIPFKVDLRYLATWFSNIDPFSNDDAKVPQIYWQKSLESFLAYQVRSLSGGIDFSVADLHAVAKLSAFLIVLDGLDEVADVSQRQEIISAIKAGVSRLKNSCISLQVLITSRPTAFLKSSGFPEITYPRFELVSITKVLINEYATNWIKARKLTARDSADVKKILKEKLDQPHLRELARNPMQLAILLSLINARGSSLPDKRTALYDSYVELFFSRESDKNPIVREHRDLLIALHQYLAWLLHSEAEQGKNRGNISYDRLQQVVLEYLIADGNEISFAEKLKEELFSGVLDRVVILVSRVQGTYEFEVQPLREYFVARYLYETAPYSPPGLERKGTKPDRFDAISRDFYWLNVTRFYAGCFSKGELPTLVDSLEVLCQTEGYSNISHPRTLAAMLLSDWVFTQNPRSMANVIKLVFNGLGIRSILTGNSRSSSETFILPKNCGHDELLDQSFKILINKPAIDYANEIISLIRANAQSEEIFSIWEKCIEIVDASEYTLWLKYAYQLGILQLVSSNQIEDLIADNPNDSKCLSILLKSKHSLLCQKTEARCKSIVDYLLNSEVIYSPRLKDASIIEAFAQAINISVFSGIFRLSDGYPLNVSHLLFDSQGLETNEIESEISNADISNETLRKCVDTINFLIKIQGEKIGKWKTDISLWIELVEYLRSLWGERWIFYRIANIANKMQFTEVDRSQHFQNLLDHSKPMCLRAYQVKSKTRSFDWWKKQFIETKNELDIMLVSMMLLTWGTSNTLINLYQIMNENFEKLSNENWYLLVDSIEDEVNGILYYLNRKLLLLDIDSLPGDISERTLIAISLRLKSEDADQLYLRYFTNYSGKEKKTLKFCQKSLLSLVRKDPKYWESALEVLEKNYNSGLIFDDYMFHNLVRDSGTGILPIEVAEKITNNAEKYPRELVKVAEAKCREAVASKIIPVGEIAKRNEWFFQI